MQIDDLQIAGRKFQSRLFLGTALYPDTSLLSQAIEASGTEMVTVSMRRIDLDASHIGSVLQKLSKQGMHILPNTAGCRTAKEAILTAQLAREALNTAWIKLEVTAHERFLLPDVTELLIATQELINQGFIVLPYCNDDLITCQKLYQLGCAAIMPLGSPIGSGMGIINAYNLKILCEQLPIPVVLDAGIGTASDVAQAMELGCSAVLVNTAIAQARHPLSMAASLNHACIAGRLAYCAGRIPKKSFAVSTSPMEGLICR